MDFSMWIAVLIVAVLVALLCLRGMTMKQVLRSKAHRSGFAHLIGIPALIFAIIAIVNIL